MSKIDWYEAGYERAMRANTGAKGSSLYPTQDKYTKEDEDKFTAGYAAGTGDFNRMGYQVAKAYVEENYD